MINKIYDEMRNNAKEINENFRDLKGSEKAYYTIINNKITELSKEYEIILESIKELSEKLNTIILPEIAKSNYHKNYSIRSVITPCEQLLPKSLDCEFVSIITNGYCDIDTITGYKKKGYKFLITLPALLVNSHAVETDKVTIFTKMTEDDYYKKDTELSCKCHNEP